jgi:uncharacterized membrane protein
MVSFARRSSGVHPERPIGIAFHAGILLGDNPAKNGVVSMDLYSIFKFLHVLSAIAWVGGGLTLLALALFAEAQKDEATVMQVSAHSAFLATRWFIPTSLATLVFGIIATALIGLWGEAWVILGLLGFAATFLTGMLGIKPLSEKIARASAEGRMDDARAEGKKIMTISKFDYVLLIVVIADMVMKPSWGDWLTLLVFALVLIGGAVLFLGLVERVQKYMPAKTPS